MATPYRPPTGTLSALDGLEADAIRFDPYEALRRLECAYSDRERLGESVRPQQDAVRLRQMPSMRFAPTPLDRFVPATEQAPAQLWQVFFGMFGPNSPLPLHLTEYAYDRLVIARDPTFARFADLFHHRLISLLYRAWATSRPAVGGDRPDSDRFGGYVDSLIGLGLPSMRGRDDWSDSSKRYFSGWLASSARTPEGLEAMLVDYFALPVRIEEYAGEWLELGRGVQLQLGVGLGVEGRLGVDTIIGEAAWSVSHRFRIVAGPIGRADLESLLPDGHRLNVIGTIIRNYLADELGWELKLVVRPAEVPRTQLGVAGKLGWNSWLAPDGVAPGIVTLRERRTQH
ncbi:MAG: type VI secretion system baseplate subunit TssG [Proteobacteria bacterium]|nr:type VI secretion system baseplate subunit TssG [Pseudomonadota bacterium]